MGERLIDLWVYATLLLTAVALFTDELLDMIRRIYKGDPEKLLKEVLDVSKLRKNLDEILSNPRLRDHLGPEASKRLDSIQGNLNKQFDAFKKEIDDWLTKGRKTSANGGSSTKAAPGAPAAKPNTQAKSGAQAKAKQGDSASSNTPNAATQRGSRV